MRKNFYGGPRGFSSTLENSQIIIAHHNEVVNNEDEVYCLGDCMLNNNDYGLEMIKSLKGKIHIICGNHDSNTRIELYKTLPNVVEVCEAKTIKVGKQLYFLCHYPAITSNYDDKPYHSHLINLHGHTHQKTNFIDNDNPFIYHVGVDSHGCYPVSIEEVSKDIHEKVQELYVKKQRGGS